MSHFSRFFSWGKFFIFQDDSVDKTVKLTSRERRFIKFSSVEFEGQLYMTPQDFLDSVVEQEARRKHHMITIFFYSYTNLNCKHFQHDLNGEHLPRMI